MTEIEETLASLQSPALWDVAIGPDGELSLVRKLPQPVEAHLDAIDRAEAGLNALAGRDARGDLLADLRAMAGPVCAAVALLSVIWTWG